MKPILFVAFVIASISVSAQKKGFFIQPQIGAGIDKPVGVGFVKWPGYCDCGVYLGENKAAASYDAQMLVGYGFSVFRVTTGLQFLRTSAPQNVSMAIYFSGVTQPWPLMVKGNEYYQLAIPLNFSWKINVDKRTSIAPGVGLRINRLVGSYTSAKHSVDIIRGTFSAFLDASIMADVEYKLNEDFGFVLTPSYSWITADIETIPETEFAGGLRAVNRDFLLWAGIRCYFHKKATPTVVKDQS